MSVGRDRKIDIYSVSMKAEMCALGIICQLRLGSPIPIIFFPPVPAFIYCFQSHSHLKWQLQQTADRPCYSKPDLNSIKKQTFQKKSVFLSLSHQVYIFKFVHSGSFSMIEP